MILWVALAAVLVLLLLLLTRWIGIRLQGDEDGLVVSASFSKWKFTLYPSGSDEKVKEEEEKVINKIEAAGASIIRVDSRDNFSGKFAQYIDEEGGDW